MPDFTYEKELWTKGYGIVGGCDEVGKGCFAGPVVAGCVVFSSDKRNTIYNIPVLIDDSKKLNVKQKETADKWIKENALSFGIGVSGVTEINKFGIVRATNKAFRRAIVNANALLKTSDQRLIDFLLSDAFYIPRIKGIKKRNQLPIIKGDQKSFSIAAASIIAKVYRDALMLKVSNNPKFQVYKWGKNKGYGTKEHREAIIQNGTTRYHRMQFVTTFLFKANDYRLTTSD